MGECIIPMRSRTEAEKGRRAAKNERILTAVVPVDPSITRHGCTVGLRVSCSHAAYLADLFDEYGIRHGEIIGRVL